MSRATSPVWLNGSYDSISSTTSASSIGVTKLFYQLKTNVFNNLFIKTQMMCYKRAWQNQIGLPCNITKTNKKQYRQ